MTVNQYDVLLKRAKAEFRKLANLSSYSDVSDPEDIISGFYLSHRYSEDDTTALMIHKMRLHCTQVRRDAIRRRDAGRIINNSQNYIVDNFEGNYRDDDLIDAYINRKSLHQMGVSSNLSDAPYKGVSGKIDYDAMLEDMQKTMCENDRLFIVRNYKTKRQYTCGDVMAIPLEMLYNQLTITKAQAKEMGLRSA